MRIVGRDDLAAAGLDLSRLVHDILELDHRVYAQTSHGHIGAYAQWRPVFERHPDSWRAVLDRSGRLVAYWQTAALRRDLFDKARRGLLNPCDLSNLDYRSLDKPGDYSMYLVSICVDPAHRNLHTQMAVVESFFRVAEQLATRDVFFEDVAAVAHSDQGRQTCVAFGMAFTGAARGHGACFEGRLASMIDRNRFRLRRRFPRLVAAYEARERRRSTVAV